ncbi:hypothetical protein [Pseudoduganella umbonata]|uniref:Uncharacterized protein n=1 Tax=Pseudoduganella umbonata TaxID=864828 RepID=A0A4P8HQZ6_9BURK|nr:hypothetical protein [Pseudoduganella umbonata]MBB3222584.1 hypothetical protein [Pseudoduganella umbonata]QCP10894.1 hypothetical protein FCL38_11005 [Pseudoduganella umbonata]
MTTSTLPTFAIPYFRLGPQMVATQKAQAVGSFAIAILPQQLTSINPVPRPPPKVQLAKENAHD